MSDTTRSDQRPYPTERGPIGPGGSGGPSSGRALLEQTDPGHAAPVIRGYREGIDPRATVSSEGDPKALESPVMLRARTGARYRLVAGSRSDGIVVPMPQTGDLSSHQRLTLMADEVGLETVQVVLQVLGSGAERFGARAVRVRWLAITATRRRAFLVAALDRMLGLRAKVCVRDDVLGPHRKLVYNPSRMQVSLVNVGAGALPSPGREPKLSSRPRMVAAQSPAVGPAPRTSEAKRATRPFVLVESGHMTDVARTLLDTGPLKVLSATSEADVVPTDSGLRERRRAGDLPAPGPVVRRPRGRGCYTVGGQLRGMGCKWIGRTHVAFETLKGAAGPLTEGDVVSVGVPGSPLSTAVIWVVGEVSRVEPLTPERLLIEVDLRRSRSVPRVYEALVEYWADQADSSSV